MNLTLNNLVSPAGHPETQWPWNGEPANVGAASSDARAWPRISVVTPSFNQGHFIEETIRSVLLQGYPNLEYIIIDGGSSDGTVEIIKKYEPWLAYWTSEKDRGQSHAINKGFARSTGAILNWLCSDDVLAPGALFQVAEALRGRRAALVVGDAIITDGPNTLNGKRDRRRPSFADMAYDVKTLAQPSVFWTRDLWQAAGPLNEDLFFVMDYDLWLRMLPAARSISFLDQVLSYERTQPNQKSGSTHSRFANFYRQRADVAYAAARARGESGLGWTARVWANKLRNARFRFWALAGSGFHWQALRIACSGVFGRINSRRQCPV